MTTTDLEPQTQQLDPKRWVVLGIVLLATLIVVLDNTILNVAIPTILEDFHTTLPSLEWVITGYALTFATLMIIGGRLGDLYGHRRVFVTGALIFAGGSLIAALSQGVPELVIGEALIEGIGASLMLPATLALLSTTFTGRERATAFAAWGAVAGSAVGLGPVLGGFLTTNFSWRWAFGINVIIAPLAALGALAVVPKGTRGRKEPLDAPGAALIALGMFLLVFALSEGGSYGWITPIKALTVAGHELWPATAPVSFIPFVFLASGLVLTAFYRHERRRERQDASPLFEFGLLEHPTFRYGLLTTMVLSMGQLGTNFALALFLQEGKGLSAIDNGLWVLPFGLAIIVGAPFGGRLANRMGATMVIRIGLVGQAIALAMLAWVMSPQLTFAALFAPLVLYGVGIGFASSQLTNVILSDVPADKSGVASGTNTTVRQVGNALGIAVIGTLVTTQTVSHAVRKVGSSGTIPDGSKPGILAQIHQLGSNFQPAPGTNTVVRAELTRILGSSVSSAATEAILFATLVITAGALLSLLIPRVRSHDEPMAEEVAEDLAGFVPIDPEGELLPAPGKG